ncbi:MAG: right-handed parallel beta-helix repeat-containing protein [Candidatus Binataceae bacterium]
MALRLSKKILVAAAVLAMTLGGVNAFAIEGVTQINDAAVQAQGGYPYKIKLSGSYRLTGNLTPGGADGIEVSASNVTIDLNGFSIIGSSGSGIGILADTGVTAVSVHNGTISAMGGAGISLGDSSAIEDVVVSGNASGIAIGGQGIVSHSVLSGNKGIGISVTGSGAVVIENSISGNTGYGLELYDGTSGYARNVVSDNDGNGTFASPLNQIKIITPASSYTNQIGLNLCNGGTCP